MAHCRHSAETSTAYGDLSLSVVTTPVSTITLDAIAAVDSVRYAVANGTDDGRHDDDAAAADPAGSDNMDSVPLELAYATFTSMDRALRSSPSPLPS